MGSDSIDLPLATLIAENQSSLTPLIPLIRIRGFTLIELLVVLAIIASLLTIVVPRFFGQVDHARETVLRENLYALRTSIDKYVSDKGHYPATLQTLVQERYLRQIPVDPVTEQNTSWKTTASETDTPAGIIDVHSGSTDTALDGSRYADW